MQTQDIDYRADADMRGYLAFDEAKAGPRPGVLVFHEGLGLGEFVMARARMLAELGYVAFAADMFGQVAQNAHDWTSELHEQVNTYAAAVQTFHDSVTSVQGKLHGIRDRARHTLHDRGGAAQRCR